jgi:hypothetical protein
LSGLTAIAASPPAVAHSGSCTVTGNTWTENRDAGRFALGSGNVDCSQVHSSIYIKVTLQFYNPIGGHWVNVANADKGPTSNVRSLYKQTSVGPCMAGNRTFRVMVFYQTTGNAHSGTVFRGQQQQDCIP